tara:strand:+ start:3400 stop:3930 length:531 start_codon:yes stop_codon:yes gene_type:complete
MVGSAVVGAGLHYRERQRRRNEELERERYLRELARADRERREREDRERRERRGQYFDAKLRLKQEEYENRRDKECDRVCLNAEDVITFEDINSGDVVWYMPDDTNKLCLPRKSWHGLYAHALTHPNTRERIDLDKLTACKFNPDKLAEDARQKRARTRRTHRSRTRRRSSIRKRKS